jgi:hypothetical protein
LTTEHEFRTELSRLYAAAHEKNLDSEDLATAAKTDRHTVARWIGGYACPDTSEEREAVLVAISRGLKVG